jgi:hypothetical protein
MKINLLKSYQLRAAFSPELEAWIIQCRCLDDESEWERFGYSRHPDKGLAEMFITLIVNRMPNMQQIEEEVSHG